VGRACVDSRYRHGGVITLLWSALLRYITERGYAYVIGCASVSTNAGAAVAASICRQLLAHQGPEEWRVFPYRAFVLEGWPEVDDAEIPSLIKAYLRLGAVVCGAPAWDAEFKTADLLVLLPVASVSQRYVNRLLRAA
jgi:putative hemolysin